MWDEASPRTYPAAMLQAISAILAVPGASNTILEARIPYANAATAALLGAPPEQFTSARCATQLAHAAYKQAAALTQPSDGPIFGLACSAALATVRSWHTAIHAMAARAAAMLLQFCLADFHLSKGPLHNVIPLPAFVYLRRVVTPA